MTKANLDGSAPIFDHLEELRRRILYSLIYLVVGAGFAWTKVPQIILLLKEPLTHTNLYQAGKLQLVATGLTEQLIFSFTIALWAGLALALPFILHQIWLFIAPGLYPNERKYAGPFIVGAGLSFVAGMAFCYYMIVPPMVKFLVDFLNGTVGAIFSIGQYMGQIITLLISFGLCFEIPILAVILTRIGIVNHVMLRKMWKYAFMVCLVLAAIITPTPDPINMSIAAAPLYVLYELGVLLSRIFRVRPEDALESGKLT
ncbi:twin-arginine translocase subunit TatC [Deinococcus irradiatisoli]|uniref:Sec-independent protein translocase protein TatC n=1 Tax=Deinococcus irradiatisoli TaxID=2202254 RepID=A0A2Z3JF28_9DEIO|nr:twin-arginine translocase subunit TatC [Deinococcus irradiatisoli]AWN23763.1 twin-arginine translocase subunit TatC [Deinococcus irradiatisoli]